MCRIYIDTAVLSTKCCAAVKEESIEETRQRSTIDIDNPMHTDAIPASNDDALDDTMHQI